MNISLSSKTHYIDGHSDLAPYLLSRQLTQLLGACCPDASAPVFVCIGTDLVTGDSLGPMVGSVLRCSPDFPYTVYGTLSRPVHAVNLSDTMVEVASRHPDSPVIAPGSLSPGAGVNKFLGTVGDISITGIINISGEYAHMILQSTRPSTVMNMAQCIAKGILLACCQMS